MNWYNTYPVFFSSSSHKKYMRHDSVYYLYRSDRRDKKYMVKHGNRTIHFGARGYSDYTLHKDYERMVRYRNRHNVRENWNDLKTAGAWSLHLLWSYTSLGQAIRQMEKRFGIEIVQRFR